MLLQYLARHATKRSSYHVSGAVILFHQPPNIQAFSGKVGSHRTTVVSPDTFISLVNFKWSSSDLRATTVPRYSLANQDRTDLNKFRSESCPARFVWINGSVALFSKGEPPSLRSLRAFNQSGTRSRCKWYYSIVRHLFQCAKLPMNYPELPQFVLWSIWRFTYFQLGDIGTGSPRTCTLLFFCRESFERTVDGWNPAN